MKLLHELVSVAASYAPDAPAVCGPDGILSYDELDGWSNRFAHFLTQAGISQGDRVAIWGERCWRLVAAMQGVLRIGAAYVPIAAGMPRSRAKLILKDCSIRWIVTDRTRFEALSCEQHELVGIFVDDWELIAKQPSDLVMTPNMTRGDLAYILYTSGSTGQPKGVCLSHQNAMSFIEWAVRALGIPEYSRFANHAAFSFDLSVFDLYAAFYSRSCVSIIPDAISLSARRLVEFIQRERITVWYSVPSALVLMIEAAKLLEQSNIHLETVIFAGEAFPIRPLRAMREAWPQVRLWNFYGPTETNVCAAYEVGHIAPECVTSVPIGYACSGDQLWLRDASGCATAGPEGELVVEGPTVMLGYWGCEPQHSRPYPTGDICRVEPDGTFVFVGRTDDMVKVRGYRIELQELAGTLATYPGITDVAVVVIGEGADARLVCFFVTKQAPPPTLIDLKEHCALLLPSYMLISLAWPLGTIPRTPNGKVDRRRLIEIDKELSRTTATFPAF